MRSILHNLCRCVKGKLKYMTAFWKWIIPQEIHQYFMCENITFIIYQSTLYYVKKIQGKLIF